MKKLDEAIAASRDILRAPALPSRYTAIAEEASSHPALLDRWHQLIMYVGEESCGPEATLESVRQHIYNSLYSAFIQGLVTGIELEMEPMKPKAAPCAKTE